MRHLLCAAVAACVVASSAPAFAEGDDGLEARIERVEQRLDAASATSSREIASAVDAYLSTASPDAALVGGPGSAGYDGGFWIRGGSFLLKINLTIQTRFEAFRWDEESDEPHPGGDLSGFSLPRVTLKLSGDATCDIHYYAELEFGHAVTPSGVSQSLPPLNRPGTRAGAAPISNDSSILEESVTREAWIEYEACPALAVRMGLVETANTRQLMTPPELQQFVDISMASGASGFLLPGYTDRNRDYGLMIHGVLGCDGAWSYLLTITNNDGPVRRNVLDQFTNDNLAYSARVNWDIKGHMGYEEGALRQHSCEWVASVGAWGYAFTDVLFDKPHTNFADFTAWGIDAAAGYGGWSLTAAFSMNSIDASLFNIQEDVRTILAQVGYLFPDTAWEIAARWDEIHVDVDGANVDGSVSEFAGAINYYIDGHSDKVTLDASFIHPSDDNIVFTDVYAAYLPAFDGDAILIRLQWQLAL